MFSEHIHKFTRFLKSEHFQKVLRRPPPSLSTWFHPPCFIIYPSQMVTKLVPITPLPMYCAETSPPPSPAPHKLLPDSGYNLKKFRT